MIKDLRFFIGSFFIIIGAILWASGILAPALVAGWNVNMLAGICYFVFGMISFSIAVMSQRKLKAGLRKEK